MAQQRLHRPDQARVEEMRKLRGSSSSPESALKEEKRQDDDQDVLHGSALDSPDGSIEVDDRTDPDLNRDRVKSDDSLPEQDSPRVSPVRSDVEDTTDATFQDASVHLRPSVENSNEQEIASDEHISRRDLKIRLEGTVDLSTKKGQDKENVGQDLTTRKKEDDTDVEKEAVRGRRDRSPKPRQVWRPY